MPLLVLPAPPSGGVRTHAAAEGEASPWARIDWRPSPAPAAAAPQTHATPVEETPVHTVEREGRALTPAPGCLLRLLTNGHLRASARRLTHPPTKNAESATPSAPPAGASASAAESVSVGLPPLVYVHQRELAVVSPARHRWLAYAGSGDATTCVIVLLVARRTQRTIVAHLDGASRNQIQDEDTDQWNGGAAAMSTAAAETAPAAAAMTAPCTSLHAALRRFTEEDCAEGIDVHLAGGFQTHVDVATATEHAQADSEPAASRATWEEEDDAEGEHEMDQHDGLLQVRDILRFLQRFSSDDQAIGGSRQVDMRLQTLCVGPLNTQWAAENEVGMGAAAAASASVPLSFPRPYLTSLFYHFPSRTVVAEPISPWSSTPPVTPPAPAAAAAAAAVVGLTRFDRGPEMVRRCVRSCFGAGHLESAYQEDDDCFVLRAVEYPRLNTKSLSALLTLPDDEFLQRSSTSPTCEPPSFLPDMRQMYGFLLHHPQWQKAYPAGRRDKRKWTRVKQTNQWTEVKNE